MVDYYPIYNKGPSAAQQLFDAGLIATPTAEAMGEYLAADADAAAAVAIAAASSADAAAAEAVAQASYAQTRGLYAKAQGDAIGNVTTAVSAAAALAGVVKTYKTKASAVADVATPAANAFIMVLLDETAKMRRTIYQKVSGALVFVRSIDENATVWGLDPVAGNNSNPGTLAEPFATISYILANNIAKAGDTIQIAKGAVIEEILTPGVRLPDGVLIKGHLGSKAIWNCFDAVPNGAWTADGTAFYTDVVQDFGYAAGVRTPGGRWYPGMIARPVANEQWVLPKRIGIDIPSQGSVAANIDYVKANPGVSYAYNPADANSTFANGYLAGTYRHYLHLPGDVSPATCPVSVLKRAVLSMGNGCVMEDIDFFGGIQHDGLVSSGSAVIRVTLKHPCNHACELPGCYTEDLLPRDGWGTGNAIHHFGGEADFYTQRYTHHVRPRVINWPGQVFGGHGVGAVGPSVTDIMIVDDLRTKNCIALGSIFALTGVTFNRPILDRIGNMGPMAPGTVFNDPRITGDAGIDPNGLFQGGSQAAGSKIQINNGRIVCTQPFVRFFAPGSTVLTGYEFNNCAIVQQNVSPILVQAGNHSGALFNRCVIECIGGSNGPVSVTTNATGGTFKFVDCSLGGMTLLGAPGVELVRTKYGGSTGIRPTGNPENPVEMPPESAWWSRDANFVDVAANVNDRKVVVLTTKALTSADSQGSGSAVPSVFSATAIPSDFAPRGVIGLGTSNKAVLFGDAGKAYIGNQYQNSVTAAGFTAVATGTAVDFAGKVEAPLNSTFGFIFGWDGSASSVWRVDGAAGTITQVAGISTAYKLRGGVAKDANTMIAWGSADDNSAGGVIYTTNGGAAWAASSLTSGKIKCGTYIPATTTFVVAGDFEALWTATDPAATWTAKNLGLNVSYRHMSTDPSSRVVMLCSSGFNPLSRSAHVIYLDGTATVANWAPKQMRSPLVSLGGVAPLLKNVFNGQSGRQWVPTLIFSRHGYIVANTDAPGQDDWIVNTPVRNSPDLPDQSWVDDNFYVQF